MWNKPKNRKLPFSKVELVHKNNLPIFMAYYSDKNEIQRKVYYSDFTQLTNIPVQIPQQIVEINFLSPTDSVIIHTRFSNIQFGQQTSTSTFDIKIPLNAKIVR